MNEISTDLFEHTTPPAMMPISSDSTPTACQTATPTPETVSAMEPRFRKSMSARRRIRRSMPGVMQNQRPSSSESPSGNVAAAERIRAEISSNPPQELQKPASEPEIVRITLDQNQVAITGLLAVITRS
jgi:hypothetical protein